jgi:hypothetical protein
MLSPGSGSSSGWRLPSYKELMTIVDETPHVEYDTSSGQLVTKWIDGDAFPAALVAPAYWTSSVAPGAASAYSVDFHSGEPGLVDVTFPGLVRCVH